MMIYVQKMMKTLNVIGTLAVEFFITNSGPIFNEMAPRPHNSGH
jgi:5-(carboxyamino)imidazole ribonucleotide synthase